MGFLIFAPLSFIVLRMTVRWSWKNLVMAAIVLGLVADAILDFLVARRMF